MPAQRHNWYQSLSRDKLLSNKSPLWRDEKLYFNLPNGYKKEDEW